MSSLCVHARAGAHSPFVGSAHPHTELMRTRKLREHAWYFHEAPRVRVRTRTRSSFVMCQLDGAKGETHMLNLERVPRLQQGV